MCCAAEAGLRFVDQSLGLPLAHLSSTPGEEGQIHGLVSSSILVPALRNFEVVPHLQQYLEIFGATTAASRGMGRD